MVPTRSRFLLTGLLIGCFMLQYACNKQPVACFATNANPTQVQPGDSLQFISCSLNFTEIEWDMGDSTTIIGQTTVNYSYDSSGVYDVILHVWNADGIEDSKGVSVIVKP